MKLLRVISSMDPAAGGPVAGIRQSQPALEQLGVDVEIACCDAPGSAWLADPALPPVHPLGPPVTGFCYSARLAPWLRANASRFDAVVVHGLWQYHGLATRQALARSSTPYFVFPHGMLDPWFKHRYPAKHLKKLLYWHLAESRNLARAQAVLFTCEEERLLARLSFSPYRVAEAVTAYGTAGPPGEAVAPNTFLAAHPELRDRRIVLFMSRIHEKKGCDLLIEAFARVARSAPDLHLVLAGPDHGAGAALRELAARRLAPGQATWLGMVEGDAKWDLLRAAEVFCLPSHQENFGIVVAEALACGRPVLVSNKVNIWREIEADGCGFAGDDTIDGTCQSLERWLRLPAAERAAMGQRARASFDRRFRADRAAQTLVDIVRGGGVHASAVPA